MTHLTFFLGQVASGELNAYCGAGCGCETDRTSKFGIHVADGTGRMRLACPDCASHYASDLARLADLPQRALRVEDISGIAESSPRYILIPVAEPVDEPAEECPDAEPITLPNP